MHYSKFLFPLFLLCSLFNTSSAQTNWTDINELFSADYRECAAIYFDGKLLVDNYTPEGKCQIIKTRSGKLTLSSVRLAGPKTRPIKNLSFRIAIKNSETNTLWMYAEEIFEEVYLEEILKECKLGDSIIFLTVDKRYSLPHHEIDLGGGC